MTRHEEAIFERKAEKHFRSHQGTPKGYDSRVLCQNGHKNIAEKREHEARYSKNYDIIFPNAPGAGF